MKLKQQIEIDDIAGFMYLILNFIVVFMGDLKFCDKGLVLCLFRLWCNHLRLFGTQSSSQSSLDFIL